MYRQAPTSPTQGSVVQAVYFDALDDEYPAVILTPTCDIEQHKVNFFTCVALRPFPEMAEQFLAGPWRDVAYEGDKRRPQLTKKQSESLEKKFRSLFSQREPRYHWFDPWIPGGDGYVADFQLVTSVTTEEMSSLEVVAQLNSEYLEALPARYVSYMGRIGTPDRGAEDYKEHFEKMIGRNFEIM
ncbi:hypothetical protein [Deinococcus phoenicis]|uniref:hypothetical protein n=1 Tax=Deinococcus phoenicis TaxID=1476583 RepID=UPI0012690274|nr:hypothetical protein [Deinococcus phoenicis]